jgi:nickel-dependent lactate racemase
MYYEQGSVDCDISSAELKKIVFETLEGLGEKKKVLIIPPDFTRFHSRAGEITCYIYEFYGKKVTDILPALGTHSAMTEEQLDEMFPGIPKNLFRVHDWRNDVITVGEVPAEYVKEISEGAFDMPWPAQINKLLVEGEYDLILSIGQVVPHEVVGMANYTKNIFVGTGGTEGINKSHFIGAAYGMEKIMGRAQTPVRKVLNYGLNFIDLPIVYFQTVIAADDDGDLKMRGIFASDEEDCFLKASDLALQVNFKMLDKPLKKVVVYLDPSEFKSTWLGNKSIYRTRMAIDDDGELIVLAPGVKEFGEDPEIDRLIRKYGYVETPQVMKFLEENQELADNLSAAAHLIHGSSEGRFTITYCPGHLTKEEIESVNFKYADVDEMMKIYDINKLKDGYNTLDNGEEIFYISNPALGLWAFKDRF